MGGTDQHDPTNRHIDTYELLSWPGRIYMDTRPWYMPGSPTVQLRRRAGVTHEWVTQLRVATFAREANEHPCLTFLHTTSGLVRGHFPCLTAPQPHV